MIHVSRDKVNWPWQVQTLVISIAITLGVLLVLFDFGKLGLFGHIFKSHGLIKISIISVLISHFTITAMSLSLHRQHTHRGVVLNPFIDMCMQLWLWAFTSISKRDWISVHAYHHAHADKELDPHSPIHKGFWHVFFLGTVDYAKARYNPEVKKLRKLVSENRLEHFIYNNHMAAPIFVGALLLVLFGPIYGSILMVLGFITSPLFAVGGVNAIAHYIGYRNYQTADNSRNIGFLVPLNFIICGELDHNNHHAYPSSCSFRHRWFEFDIGYVYLKILAFFKLAKIRNVYKLSPDSSRN